MVRYGGRLFTDRHNGWARLGQTRLGWRIVARFYGVASANKHHGTSREPITQLDP